MNELFEQFIRERQLLKDVTPATIKWYRCAWRAAGKHLPGRSELNASALKQCVIQLRASGISTISANTYLRVINAFLRWLHSEGHVATLLKIPRLNEDQKVMRTFTLQQVRALVGFVPASSAQARVHLLTCLLADTGIRIKEALTLRQVDVNLETMLLTVYGKGRKERVVPFSPFLRKLLYRWFQNHQHELVFYTRSGQPLSYRNAMRDFSSLAKHVGIVGRRASFHTLRHTFGSNYIRQGGNVFMLQRVLGHSTLEMTRRYVTLQTADLSKVHQQLSPLSAASGGS